MLSGCPNLAEDHLSSLYSLERAGSTISLGGLPATFIDRDGDSIIDGLDLDQDPSTAEIIILASNPLEHTYLTDLDRNGIGDFSMLLRPDESAGFSDSQSRNPSAVLEPSIANGALVLTSSGGSALQFALFPEAGLQEELFTVTFDYQDPNGVFTTPHTVAVAAPATTVGPDMPDDPVSSGYNFAGWWTEINGGGTQFTSLTAVTGDITVYAKWSAHPVYTVAFDSTGGSAVGSQMVVEGEAVSEPSAPTRGGYLFEGWYADAGLTTPWDFANSPVSDDVTLYADWSLVTYTINYVLNAAPDNGGNPFAYTVESPGITLAAPVRSGFTFGGWYEDSAFTFPVTEIATGTYGDMTFYAKWTCLVSFVTNGGTAVADQIATDGKLATEPPVPSRAGATFAGWYSDPGFTTVWNFTSDVVTGDTTLYAKWTYLVVFESNGGTPVSSQNVVVDGLMVPPPEPSREDYFVEGWYIDPGFSTVWDFGSNTVSGNMTLYLKWLDPRNAFLSLDGIDDYVTVDSVCTSLEGSNEITLEAWIYPENFTNLPYFLAFNSGTATGLQFGVVDLGGGLGALKVMTPVLGTPDQTVTSLSLSTWTHVALTINASGVVTCYIGGVADSNPLANYSFAVASTDSFSIGQEYDAGGPSDFFQGSIDDIRIWNYARTEIEISANFNTPLNGNEPGLVAYYECTDTSGSVLTDSSPAMNDGAIIRSPVTYAVTYDGNGHTGGTAPVDPVAYVVTDPATILSSGTLEKLQDGISLRFTQWNTMPDGSGTGYNSGDTYTVMRDTTLYAQWDVLGGMGPAGGWVFYDNGNINADGWRYLEVSFEQTTATWASPVGLVGVPQTAMGTGKLNTLRILHWLNANGQTGQAVQYANDHAYGGYTDWYLPSGDELHTIWTGLVGQNLGNFPPAGQYFASSSEIDSDTVVGEWMEPSTLTNNVYSSPGNKTSSNGTRPIRAFRTASPTYVVFYDPNNADSGTAPVDPYHYEPGETATILNQGTLARAGYSFAGWNTAPDGSGVDYPPGTNHTVASDDLVLYADWVPLPGTLLARWTFDGTILDAQGTNDATGSPIYVAANPGKGLTQSLSLDGTYKLDVPAIDLGDQFSVSVWVVFIGAANINTIFANSSDFGNDDGFKLYINTWSTSDQALVVGTGDGTNEANAISAANAVPLNLWRHLVFLVDKTTGTGQAYLNGVAVPLTGAINTTFASNRPLVIGGVNTGAFLFNGYMSDMRIYSGLLSPTEITTIFNE